MQQRSAACRPVGTVRTAVATMLVSAISASAAAIAGTPLSKPQSRYVSLPAYASPGTPAYLNRIAYFQHWAGPKPDAPLAIVILVPGYMGGAEDFRYVGERLVQRLSWLQVWAVDRRNNFLENRSGMRAARAAKDPRVAAAYYLGKTDLPGCPPHSSPTFALSQARAATLGMGGWGLQTELEDIRFLIASAHRRYPRAKIYLGGHSLGGMTAQVYAGWRFGDSPKTAGWHTIDGIILIDGAVDGPHWQSRLIPQYLRDKKMRDAGLVYWDDLTVGASPLMGQLTEIAAMACQLKPEAESILWQGLPAAFRWPNPRTAPTNKALFAAFSDDQYGKVPDFRLHQGDLAVPVDQDRDGKPDHAAAPNQDRLLAHWQDFDRTTPRELSSTDVWARALWQRPETNGFEWYFSIRLNADVDLASNLDSRAIFRDPVTAKRTSAAQREGHRIFDTSRVAVPVYAFAAAEGRDRFEWYRSVARSAAGFTLVDHSKRTASASAYSHIDPLFAADTGGFTNAFLASLADWLADRQHQRSRKGNKR